MDEDMGESRDEDPRSPPRPASSSQARPARSSGQEDIGNQPQLVQYGHRDFLYVEYPYGFGQPRPAVSRPPQPAPAPYEDFDVIDREGGTEATICLCGQAGVETDGPITTVSSRVPQRGEHSAPQHHQ